MSINMSKKEFIICVELSFLNRHGIKLIGVSSDGDSRLLNAMKSVMKFELTPESNLELLVFIEYGMHSIFCVVGVCGCNQKELNIH